MKFISLKSLERLAAKSKLHQKVKSIATIVRPYIVVFTLLKLVYLLFARCISFYFYKKEECHELYN